MLLAQAQHANSYNGYTLKVALAHAASLSGNQPYHAYVDRRYRHHEVEKAQAIITRDKTCLAF